MFLKVISITLNVEHRTLNLYTFTPAPTSSPTLKYTGGKNAKTTG